MLSAALKYKLLMFSTDEALNCLRENVPFRVTLQPNGAAVFETANAQDLEQTALDQWRSERGQS